MQTWLSSLQAHRAIAVLRTPDLKLGRALAQSAIAGGMGIIEITWNSAEPAKLIAKLRETFPHCLIGTGTVLTLADLENAIACGSQFCFTPHVNAELIKKAIQAEIPIIPGALTPTEIVTAWQLGANAVKVFPVQSLGGAEYIKSLQGPLGHIPLIPTGGVTPRKCPFFCSIWRDRDRFIGRIISNESYSIRRLGRSPKTSRILARKITLSSKSFLNY